MRIIRRRCTFCGSPRKNEEDINLARSYCSRCHEARRGVARKAFAGRRTELIDDGLYVVSHHPSRQRSN